MSSATKATAVPHRWQLPDETGILAMLIIVFALFCAMSPNMRTLSNGLVLLLNGAVIGLLALGQTFVLLVGGIDLSTGANIAFMGVLVSLLMSHGLAWPLAIFVTLLCGTLMGMLNGLIVQVFRVPSFIVTFSTMGVASSMALIITGANSISVTQSGFAFVGQGRFLGVPVPVLILAVMAILAGLLLSKTILGTHIYAVGGNREAAHLAGVNLTTTTIVVYAISGLCASLGGIVDTARLMVGFPTTGLGDELFFSIAAAVIGGVSLFGGVGRVQGAMIGAVLIAVVSDGMNVLNVSSYWQSLVIGVIVLIAVIFDTYRRRNAGTPMLESLRSLLRNHGFRRSD
ncbi:MAG TPA: ABC transporter permease [Acidisoma sp.]|uniref:ABC transporter permease n=1 Tax=Acidisoma sp. TaxID=1872115 RepID=UPI002BC0A40B|nr:ABC transporter permease [Acidisoma sp.]HTI01769.1 ABC transporter permease [Acidisoma sp.]